MIKKMVINIVMSLLTGLMAVWLTSLVNLPNNCYEGGGPVSGTCFETRGFPLAFLSGTGYAGLPWHVDVYSLILNILIWFAIFLIIFSIFIPLLQDRILKKAANE